MKPLILIGYAETGATAHMTNEVILFLALLAKVKKKDLVGGGIGLDISRFGNVILQSSPSNIALNNVLVVQEIKKNLLSVNKLTNHDSCLFEVSSSRYKIKGTGDWKSSGNKE